jgi:hypothetical protein
LFDYLVSNVSRLKVLVLTASQPETTQMLGPPLKCTLKLCSPSHIRSLMGSNMHRQHLQYLMKLRSHQAFPRENDPQVFPEHAWQICNEQVPRQCDRSVYVNITYRDNVWSGTCYRAVIDRITRTH